MMYLHFDEFVIDLSQLICVQPHVNKYSKVIKIFSEEFFDATRW